ncbi:MAG: ABC transporter ATP-binding protein [Polyangiaceae bacterium]|nr:ABC transporter ATP-binding protein [Polyangiaceae bacterium]
MPAPGVGGVRRLSGVLRYTWQALSLVWGTNRSLAAWLAALSLTLGLFPAATAWVGKVIVDGVVQAATSGSPDDRWSVMMWVTVELGLVVLMTAAQRARAVADALLRVQLAEHVHELVLEKALTLPLSEFEDSETYDRITRTRREASFRPLSLARRALDLVQGSLSLLGYAVLVSTFSPWLLLLLGGAAAPAFLAETRLATDAFRLFRWRAPEERRRYYLETVLARDDHAKEVKLLELGAPLLARYRAGFRELYAADRRLTVRRGVFGFSASVAGALALAAAYAWIAWDAVDAAISVGTMTMLMVVLRQAQAALTAFLGSIAGMYDDNQYVTLLYELLEQPVPASSGKATAGPDPRDGIRFVDVGFTYPGAPTPALSGVNLHVPPGTKLALVGRNGSGKTTLVKLLTRLYAPSEGRVLLDGLDLAEWDETALRRRIGVIFQDFVRYQLTAGENVGVGDVRALDDEARWREAAERALVHDDIMALPLGYRTQLGKWFAGGQELSLGEWQKIALSRAFVRRDADVLILDEPTASLDAEAEAQIFSRFRDLIGSRIGIVISHRFSTVRVADQIAVLDGGRVVELGTHDSLVARGGRYAMLFAIQAAGYR